jgi:cytochrome c oxidase assembly factor CtaG/ferredoxin
MDAAVWSSWTYPFWATFGLLITGLIYLRGWHKIRQSRPLLFPSWRAACFVVGLLSIWIALASPLDTFDGLLLSAHMTQHLILMSVAPPLLLLGSPAVPLLRGLPRSLVREGLGPFFRTTTLRRVFHGLTSPVFAWFAMNLAYLGWHIPRFYELALRSPGWHEVEHAFFLGTSLLFWFPIIQPWPSGNRMSRWFMLPYLVAADVINTAFSAFLTFSGRVVYPSYEVVPRLFGTTALSDQVAAGALMWVIGSIFYLVPVMIVTGQLLSPKSRRRAANATPGKVAPQQPLDLLRWPVLGSLLRARYGRMALQGIAFAATVLVIADGFRGHPMGAMNLAGVLPWTYIRAFGVLALLIVGNVFCMACPFMLPREVGHRLGLAKFRWPQWLRTKWLAVVLLIVFFWSYEAFAIWDHPSRTVWLLLAYFAAAFLVDTFFRGASFCKYVCPLGQFNFAASLLSPFSLQARSQQTCGSCTTRDCIVGNAQQRGCELQLYMPQKVGNMDCTLCMDCVKACPHDNIGLLALAPSQPPARTFARRVDVAALCLVVVLAAFINAGLMIASTGAALAMVAVFAAVTVAVGHPWNRERFCRLATALLPLGLGMWAAHLVFHLFTAWSTLAPALRQASMDFGLHLLAPPQWGGESPLLAANDILSAQLLLLDAGLLLSLYLGWRLARQWETRPGRAVLTLLPWASAVMLGYAAGVWILLQPMQMRGMIMSA